MEQTFNSPYMTGTGVAKHLGITPGVVIGLIKKGDLPSLVKAGNRILFEREDLERRERGSLISNASPSNDCSLKTEY